MEFFVSSSKRPIIFACFLIFLVLLISYSNSFTASWQFDDQPNILNNKNIQIENLSFESLKKSCFSPKNKNKISRPVAMISFALNWYFHQDNLFGYHLVNFFIHFVNACLLLFCIILLFKTPKLKEVKVNLFFISVLSVLLWALNPIQTQAVTYIVQRMVLLAAFFYLLGILFYLKARLSNAKKYYFFVFISYLLAVLSKENAAVLPATLLLIEIFFFNKDLYKKDIFIWAGILCIIFVLVCIFFGNSDFLFFVKGYSGREFTLNERLYTQGRVLIFYISQLFYPLPDRLSLSHYIPLSQSMFVPLTTFFSFIAIFFLIGFSWIYKKKYPLLCFGILFFFLNHVIESSIIPLELIFEHRNYIPSLFIFLPISYLFYKCILMCRSIFIYNSLIICIIIVLIFFGVSTYQRNIVWQTKKSLWEDALSKNPQDPRALNNYAINLAWTSKKKKDKYLAINLFKESLNYPMPRKLVRAEVYGNIANIYSNMNLNMRALPYYDKALKLDNRNTKIRFDYIKLLFLLGKIEEADKNADILISSNVKNPDYYNLKGFILLWKKQEIEALQYFQKALNFDPYNYKNILINTGFALSELGFYKKAEWFYKYSVKYKPQTDVYEIFLLIENSIKSGDLKKADSFTDILFDNFSIYQILSDLKKIEKIKTHPPLKKSNFDFFIKEKIIKTIEKAENKKVF